MAKLFTNSQIDAITHVDGVTVLAWAQKLNIAAADCYAYGARAESRKLEARSRIETARPAKG